MDPYENSDIHKAKKAVLVLSTILLFISLAGVNVNGIKLPMITIQMQNSFVLYWFIIALLCYQSFTFYLRIKKISNESEEKTTSIKEKSFSEVFEFESEVKILLERQNHLKKIHKMYGLTMVDDVDKLKSNLNTILDLKKKDDPGISTIKQQFSHYIDQLNERSRQTKIHKLQRKITTTTNMINFFDVKFPFLYALITILLTFTLQSKTIFPFLF